VGVGRYSIGRPLEAAPERRRLRAVRADEQSAAVSRERRELRAKRAQLVVIAAHVVDDTDRRMVADQRAVGLAGLGDRGGLGRTGHEAARSEEHTSELQS